MDKIFMNTEQAEEIVIADKIGVFHGTGSELAHAKLLLHSRPDCRVCKNCGAIHRLISEAEICCTGIDLDGKNSYGDRLQNS